MHDVCIYCDFSVSSLLVNSALAGSAIPKNSLLLFVVTVYAFFVSWCCTLVNKGRVSFIQL